VSQRVCRGLPVRKNSSKGGEKVAGEKDLRRADRRGGYNRWEGRGGLKTVLWGEELAAKGEELTAMLKKKRREESREVLDESSQGRERKIEAVEERSFSWGHRGREPRKASRSECRGEARRWGNLP